MEWHQHLFCKTNESLVPNTIVSEDETVAPPPKPFIQSVGLLAHWACLSGVTELQMWFGGYMLLWTLWAGSGKIRSSSPPQHPFDTAKGKVIQGLESRPPTWMGG